MPARTALWRQRNAMNGLHAVTLSSRCACRAPTTPPVRPVRVSAFSSLSHLPSTRIAGAQLLKQGNGWSLLISRQNEVILLVTVMSRCRSLPNPSKDFYPTCLPAPSDVLLLAELGHSGSDCWFGIGLSLTLTRISVPYPSLHLLETSLLNLNQSVGLNPFEQQCSLPA